jgi:branched-chain amino acid transport system permease protein
MNLRATTRYAVVLACGAALALVPEFARPGTRDVAFTFLTYAVLAQAWNLIGGFGGQFSLGNSVFVGFGAYATAWLLINTPIPPLLAVAIATLAVIPFACATSFALFRLHGVYLSVGTLAIVLAVGSWMANWSVTGAAQGLNIPFDRVLPDQTIYALVVLLALLSTCAALYFEKSDFGLSLQAVRDDEAAAISVGVAAFPVKMIAFAMSAAFTSAMGSLVALRQISIEPTSMFGMGWTISMVVMTVVGGIGTVWGPLLGAFVIFFGLEKRLEAYQDVSTLLTGILLIVVVRFLPHGLSDALRPLVRAVRTAAGPYLQRRAERSIP